MWGCPLTQLLLSAAAKSICGARVALCDLEVMFARRCSYCSSAESKTVGNLTCNQNVHLGLHVCVNVTYCSVDRTPRAESMITCRAYRVSSEWSDWHWFDTRISRTKDWRRAIYFTFINVNYCMSDISVLLLVMKKLKVSLLIYFLSFCQHKYTLSCTAISSGEAQLLVSEQVGENGTSRWEFSGIIVRASRLQLANSRCEGAVIQVIGA